MCITLAVGKHATRNGSIIIAHSDDDVADERLIRVRDEGQSARGQCVPSITTTRRGPLADPATGKNCNASGLYRYIGASPGPGYEIDAARMVQKDLVTTRTTESRYDAERSSAGDRVAVFTDRL